MFVLEKEKISKFNLLNFHLKKLVKKQQQQQQITPENGGKKKKKTIRTEINEIEREEIIETKSLFKKKKFF